MDATAVLHRVADINTNVEGTSSDINKSNTPQGPAMIPSLLPTFDIVTAPPWNHEQPSTLSRFNTPTQNCLWSRPSKEATEAMYWEKKKDERGWKGTDKGWETIQKAGGNTLLARRESTKKLRKNKTNHWNKEAAGRESCRR